MAFTTPGTAVAGEVLTAAFWNTNVRDNLTQLGTGYTFVETVYFTSSGTFTKSTYPWLRAIRVKCQGAGGGGGGAGTTGGSQNASGGGGGPGGYAESFITDIAGLDSSVTVTVPGGGAGSAAGANNGSGGGDATFGALVSGGGGGGGEGSVARAIGSFTSIGGALGVGTGDLVIEGTFSCVRGALLFNSNAQTMPGGDAVLGRGSLWTFGSGTGTNGGTGAGYGGGGGGATNAQNQATNRSGGNGQPGIVIVELFA